MAVPQRSEFIDELALGEDSCDRGFITATGKRLQDYESST